MKSFLITLMPLFMCSCATVTLSQNVRNAEVRSSTRISSEGITDGAHIQNLKFLGVSQNYRAGSLVYKIVIDATELSFVVPRRPQDGDVLITDKEISTKNDASINDLKVVFSMIAPPEIILRDLSGDEPCIYVNITDSKEWARLSNGKHQEYDSMRGMATVVDNGKLLKYGVGQDLKVETSTKIGNAAKSLGYFVTLPFDIVTSPIQGVWFVIEIGKSMPH